MRPPASMRRMPGTASWKAISAPPWRSFARSAERFVSPQKKALDRAERSRAFSRGQLIQGMSGCFRGSVLHAEAGILDDLAPALELFLEEFLKSEEHTSELQSRENLVCRLLLEKKKQYKIGRRRGIAQQQVEPLNKYEHHRGPLHHANLLLCQELRLSGVALYGR